jgi:hypothetical protein
MAKMAMTWFRSGEVDRAVTARVAGGAVLNAVDDVAAAHYVLDAGRRTRRWCRRPNKLTVPINAFGRRGLWIDRPGRNEYSMFDPPVRRHHGGC